MVNFNHDSPQNSSHAPHPHLHPHHQHHQHQSEKAFKEYWRKLMLWNYFPHLFSFFNILYILEKVISYWSTVNQTTSLIRILISSVILIILPFLDSKQFRQLTLTATGCLLIIAIVNLERVFQRHQCFLSLYFLMICYRILQTRTFYDNFALCVSFTSDVSPLGNGNTKWYITCNLFLWSYFWIVWFFQNAYKRNSFRIWEHLQILLIFKGKQDIEIQKRNQMIQAHFHRDMLNHLFPNGVNTNGGENTNNASTAAAAAAAPAAAAHDFSGSLDHSDKSSSHIRSPFVQRPKESQDFSQQQNVNVDDNAIENDPLFRYAEKENLVMTCSYGNINLQQLQSLNGLDRRNSSLIAVKIDKGESEECAFTADREQNIHQMMDALAEQYQITSIRRFGGVWIGSLGFFRTPAGKRREKLLNGKTEDPNSFNSAPQQMAPAINSPSMVLSSRKEATNETTSPFKLKSLNPSSSQQQYDDDEKSDSFPIRTENSKNMESDLRLISSSSAQLIRLDDGASEVKKERDREEKVDKEDYDTLKNNEDAAGHQIAKSIKPSNIPEIAGEGGGGVRGGGGKEKDRSNRDVDIIYHDCLNSLKFVAELQIILNQCGFRLTAAIDYGNILGGFVNSPHFDFFGQEIRWLLKTVDLHEFGRIIISDIVREQFQHHLTNEFSFHRYFCEYPWKKENYVAVTALSNPEQLFSKQTPPKIFGDFLLKKYSCKTIEELAEIMLNTTWFTHFDPDFQQLNRLQGENQNLNKHDVDSLVDQRRSVKKSSTFDTEADTKTHLLDGKDDKLNGEDGGNTEQRHRPTAISSKQWWSQIFHSYLNILYWYEDLGIEFKTALKERWSVDLSDPILAKHTQQNLSKKVNELEGKLYDVLRTVCFPTIFSLLFSRSLYQRDLQSKEERKKKQKEVVPDPEKDRTKIESEYEDVMIFLPFISLWILPFNKMKSLFWFGIWGSTRSRVASALDEAEEAVRVRVEKEPSKSETVIRKSSTRFYDQHYRTWSDYVRDARLFCHLNLLNLGIEIMVLGVVWYALLPVFSLATFDWNECIFINVFIFHCLASRQIDKQYERSGNYVLVGCVCVIFIFFPCYLVREIRESAFGSYGDWGGDVCIMLFMLLRIPNHMHQEPWISTLEAFGVRLIFYLIRYKASNCELPFSATYTTVLLYIAIFYFYYLLQYRCYMAYLLEHHLLYYSAQQYEKQKENTSRIFTLFNPQLQDALPEDGDEEDDPYRSTSNYHHLYHFRQLYRNTAVAVVHLKIADIGSTLFEPRDFLKLIASIQENIYQIFQDFGVLRVTSFSGLFVAVVSKNGNIINNKNENGNNRNNQNNKNALRHASSVSPSSSSSSTASSNVAHNLHVLYLLKRIQRSMERFSIDQNFNVSLGISVNTGNVYLGFLGNHRYQLDTTSTACDVAVTMASHSPESGMYIAREFEHLVPSIIPNPENHVHRQMMKDDRFGFYWLRFDGNVSGMQLHDFMYSGMLGKGGYGSVHLVQERYTKENLAVKVIVLKNSVMSRMIKRECIILQKMQHPNIVKFQYSFLSNNRLYLVMKYITGGNLKQVIDRDTPTLLQLRIWFAELIAAIEYIHEIGIIHRDIKPANCMISDHGVLQLADFGLSKSIVRKAATHQISNIITSTNNNNNNTYNYQQAEVTGTPQRSSVTSAVSSSSSTVTSSSSLEISNDVRDKLARFFPLKSHLTAAGEGKIPSVKALIINSTQTEKVEDKIVHSHFVVEYIKTNKTGGDTILPNINVEIVFMELNPEDNTRDACEIIKEIRRTSRYTTPVYVLKVSRSSNNTNRAFIDSGAADCFEKEFLQLDEELLAKIYNIASYDYQRNSSYQIETSAISTVPAASSRGSSFSNSNNLTTPNEIGSFSSPSLSINGGINSSSSLVYSSASSSPATVPSGSSGPMNLQHQGSSLQAQLQDSQYRSSNAQVFSFNHLNNLESSNASQNQKTMPSRGATGFSESDDKDHIVGTIHFIAPEILKTHYYSVCSDWWACGITFYYCVVRKHLFSGEVRNTIFENILNEPINLSALDPYQLTPPIGIKELVNGLLQRDIRDRYGQYGTDVLKAHVFFKDIPWKELSTYETNRLHPRPFAVKKFNVADKATFHGDSNVLPNNGGGVAGGNTVAGTIGPSGNNPPSASEVANAGVAGSSSYGPSASLNAYSSREMDRKNYNIMKMDFRNDYLLNRHKKSRKRLAEYRRRKFQHVSIKHQKRLKLENNERGTTAGEGTSASSSAIDQFAIPSYEAYSAANGATTYDNLFYDVESSNNYSNNSYYSSREKAQLQYISQKQMFSDSFSSSNHTEASFYSDKTIYEEDNENEEEEESQLISDHIINSKGKSHGNSLSIDSGNSYFLSGQMKDSTDREKRQKTSGSGSNSQSELVGRTGSGSGSKEKRSKSGKNSLGRNSLHPSGVRSGSGSASNSETNSNSSSSRSNRRNSEHGDDEEEDDVEEIPLLDPEEQERLEQELIEKSNIHDDKSMSIIYPARL